MKKNNITFKFIFSIIVSILAICLFIFMLKVIENKNQHTSVVLINLEEKMKEKENAILFAEKIAEIQLIQDSINNHFVDPNNINVFVDYLEGIGLDLGSLILVNSIEIPVKTQNIVSLRLSIKGKFQDVMKTIAFLENIPYQIDVTQVYLNKDIEQSIVNENNQDNLLTWSADVSFNILSRK